MNIVHPLKDINDIERMKEVLSSNKRNYLLFIIGINTALRISDILPLRVSDINGDYIIVREKKTRKPKRIKINEAIKSAIYDYLPADASPSDFLFPSRKGNAPISRIQAWRILNNAASKASIEFELGTHSLRKTFAYHAYKKGVDISLLMRILNHASQRETLRYIGIESDQIDEVYVDVCL